LTQRRRSRKIARMSLYELVLLLHVVAVIVWLGAAVTLTLLILRAELAKDLKAKADINAWSEWLAVRLFIPASVATLIFGLWAMAEGPWGLDQLWVAIGLAGWLVSFLTGILYFKPEGERIDAMVAELGAEHADVQRRLDQMELVGRIELAVLFIVVADMVVKPTSDDTGVLITGAALLAAIAGLLLASARPHPAAARP
jgi:uncharacterized membrane protein